MYSSNKPSTSENADDVAKVVSITLKSILLSNNSHLRIKQMTVFIFCIV